MNLQSVKNGMIALVILLVNQLGYSRQLTVINQDYELAKEVSIKQGKLLIIDFYTTWCVPCKELDAAVFKDTTVSKQIAERFVVLKYDAEKDSAHRLTLKHHVSMYPTTIVLNRDQRVVNRLYGLGDAGKGLVPAYFEFLEKAGANAAENKFIKGVSASTSQAYPKFYEEYVYRVNTKDTDSKMAAFWQTKPDYLSEVSFAVLCYFAGGTEEVNTFFIQNRKKYEELYGELDVRFIVSMMVTKKLFDAITAKDRAAFDAGILFANENLGPDAAKSYLTAMEERMLQQENRWPEALKKFSVRRKEQQLDDDATTRFCRAAYEKCTDMNVLQACKAWMKAITGKNPSYDNLDIYARLLFKTGDKKQGYANMERAIAAGKLSKEDTAGSEKWLKEVRK